MHLSYFDIETLSPAIIEKSVKKLKSYRVQIAQVIQENDNTQAEYSLVHVENADLHQQLADLKKQFKGIKHLVLVGIGGSDLGTKAVHEVLDEGKVTLHSLDTVSAFEVDQLLKTLAGVKSAKKIAICVISKSGNTAETLVNAGILLDTLKQQLGEGIYKQTIFIGNSGTDFMKAGKKLGVNCVGMPEIVGGRYSVTTEVGLVPLTLLGHDVDSFIDGVVDSSTEEFESVTAESAARIYHYIQKGYRSYNFFAFEPRLERLGMWYRQLFAESLGKTKDRDGKEVTKGMLPTISTAVELHSVGQLYLSGFAGVYTDFVTFDDDSLDFKIPKTQPSKLYGRFTIQEVATAIYGGVIGAYNEKQLPHRATILDEDLPYSLGLFMGMRMREVMYVAELMNLNAFDQPNVELYKDKTRAILKI